MRHLQRNFVPARSSPLSNDHTHDNIYAHSSIDQIPSFDDTYGSVSEPEALSDSVRPALMSGINLKSHKYHTPNKISKLRKSSSKKQLLPIQSINKSLSQCSENYNKNVNIPNELLSRLKDFSLFKMAPKLFYNRIASKLKLMQYHPQEYIIKKGESAKAMYWILKGSVDVTSTDGESIYAELAQGSYFGEIGILFNRPRTATVVSRTKVLVGVLTAESLNVVLTDYPVIERRIRDEAQERLAMQDKRNKYSLPLLPLTRSNNNSNNNNTNNTNTNNNNNNSNAPKPQFELSSLMSNNLIIPPISSIFKDQNQNIDSSISIRDFLKNLPIFQSLNPNIIHELALGVEPRIFQTFEIIFKKNDTGSDIFFIINGEVEVIDPIEKSTSIDRVLARLGPGQYFGEMSFLSNLNEQSTRDFKNIRSASIRAISKVDLLVVKYEQLINICDKYPLLLEEFKRTAGERYKNNSSSGSVDSNFSSEEHNTNRISVSSLITPSQDQMFDSNWKLIFDDSNNGFEEEMSPVAKHDATNDLVDHVKNIENYDDINSPLQSPKYERRDSIFTFDSISYPNQNRESFNEFGREDAFPSIPSDKSLQFHTSDNNKLNFHIPPLSSILPSMNNFENPEPRSLNYLPHSTRSKLINLQGRRKSSVLSTGPFPENVLIDIFSLFLLPELMKLRLVCNRWRQLLHFAPTLVNDLNLKPWGTIIDDKALIAITNFVGLRPRSIDVSDCFHVTDEGYCFLINEVGIGGNLKSLKMSSTWEISSMAIMDIATQSVGKDLEEIDVSNCRRVKDDVVERLLGWNESVPKNSTKSFDFDKLLDGKANQNSFGCKKLKKLNLGYCKHITDRLMYHIAIHANDRIESLNLTRCTAITDNGFNFWSYQSFPRLTELSLADCTFLTDKSIISITSSAINLRSLNLSFCCALSDMSVEVLSMGCPYLEHLDLSFCGSAVSDSSLVTISINLHHLKSLHLKGCVRVTRAGIDALLSGCHLLKYINVSQCRNSHIYPGGLFAQQFSVKPGTRSAFVTAGTYQHVVEIVI